MAIKMAKKVKDIRGVLFTFADGTELRCDTEKLTEHMMQELAVHGLSQKVGDSYSSSETVRDAVESAKQTWQNLLDGNFNARIQGNGGILAEAIARIKGMSLEDAQEAIRELDDETKVTLAKNAQVKATIEILRGEKAVQKLAGLTDELVFNVPKAKKPK